MRSAHFRRSAAAATLALGGIVLFSGTAVAAPAATITLSPDEVVFTDEPLEASGVCIDRSRTAVVTVRQGSDIVDEVAVTLGADLAYSVTLDLSSASTALAVASVDCFRYADAAPLDSAEAELFIASAEFVEIPVTVSPSKVAIGGTFTITGKCPAGTESAMVLAGSGESEEPFLDEEVTPAADGTVTLTSVLKAGEFVTVGDAGAVVFCGSENEAVALGFAEFTILPAAAAPKPAASARPELANTGSDNGPLTALGAGLMLLGAGAYGARRINSSR